MVLTQQYTYTLSASATTCACEVAWVSLDVVCTTHQKPFVLDTSNRCGIATVDDGLLAGKAHPTKNWASLYTWYQHYNLHNFYSKFYKSNIDPGKPAAEVSQT